MHWKDRDPLFHKWAPNWDPIENIEMLLQRAHLPYGVYLWWKFEVDLSNRFCATAITKVLKMHWKDRDPLFHKWAPNWGPIENIEILLKRAHLPHGAYLSWKFQVDRPNSFCATAITNLKKMHWALWASDTALLTRGQSISEFYLEQISGPQLDISQSYCKKSYLIRPMYGPNEHNSLLILHYVTLSG